MIDDMNKGKVITLRIDDDEHERWTAAAEADDRSLSSWIRRACNAAAPVEQPKRKRAR